MSERTVAGALCVALALSALSQVGAQNAFSTKDGANNQSFLLNQKTGTAPNGFQVPQTSRNQVQTSGMTPASWRTTVTAAPTTTTYGSQNGIWTPSPSSATPAHTPAAQPAATGATTPTTAGTGATTPTTAGTGASTTAATPAAGAAAAKGKKKDDSITVCEGPANAAKAAGWQRFDNWIILKSDQDQLSPLNLVVTNGGSGAIGLQQLQLMLSGRPIAAQKDFVNGVLTMSLSGLVSRGENQLVIKGYGPADAKLSWKVTTFRPVLTSATPNSIAPGAAVTLAGRNFSTKASIMQVMFGDKAGTITKAGSKQIIVTAPNDITGEQKVVVWVGGIATKAVTVTVKGAPELTSVSLDSGPSGTPCTVTGKGFSAKSSENQVTVGGLTAQITAASAGSISFIIPEMESPQWGVQITVITNSVPSKNNLTVNVQRRFIENQGAAEK
jgi:hypothetical protein